MIGRVALGAGGAMLAGFGVLRLLTQVDPAHLLRLGIWLVAALVLHDGIVSPLVGAAGVLTRVLPTRGRRYVQAGLCAGALVTAVAVPFVHRSGFDQPASKALLRQNYAANLAILLALVAATTALCYGIQVVRDRRSPAQPDE